MGNTTQGSKIAQAKNALHALAAISLPPQGHYPWGLKSQEKEMTGEKYKFAYETSNRRTNHHAGSAVALAPFWACAPPPRPRAWDSRNDWRTHAAIWSQPP